MESYFITNGFLGIRQHEESELYKQCLMKYESKLHSETYGTIIEQLNSTKVNTRESSLDYLRAVARSFIFLLQQEFAFMNLKDLIKLQQLNLSEPIVRWLSVANKKESYWSGESRADWLISAGVTRARETHWAYHCQIANFAWTHLVAIVSALIQIGESSADGSDTANGYAIRFVNEIFICLDSTVVRIKNALSEFDYDTYNQKIKVCRNALPVTQRTPYSTRSYRSTNNNLNQDNTNADMQTDLNSFGTKFINSRLQSIDERFGEDSRIIMDNILMFTKLNEYNNDEVLKNPLTNLYCSPMHYNHKVYERTDEPLLCFRNLEKELPQLRVLLKTSKNDIQEKKENNGMNDEVCLLDVVKFLSVNGQYLVPEWF
ncbi:unnamed protein product [Rotaria magnacalcarata]|uniref:Uncharacterized protein n=4 Tax=Rotaria magnacalcarata TaxID=392030 RepID=A0A8S2Z7P5_9BILA|nr:unnamed protein product [Rotaria magnacalcarata]